MVGRSERNRTLNSPRPQPRKPDSGVALSFGHSSSVRWSVQCDVTNIRKMYISWNATCLRLCYRVLEFLGWGFSGALVKGSGDGGGSGGRSVWMWCSLEKRLLAVVASNEARRGEARGLWGLEGKRAWVKEDKMLLLTGTLLHCCSLYVACVVATAFASLPGSLRGSIELSSPPSGCCWIFSFSLWGLSLFPSHKHTHTHTQHTLWLRDQDRLILLLRLLRFCKVTETNKERG